MVCHGASTNDCWEPRHPQDYVRGVRDDQGVRLNMRPEPEDVFIEIEAVGISAPSGYILLAEDAYYLTDDDASYLVEPE